MCFILSQTQVCRHLAISKFTQQEICATHNPKNSRCIGQLHSNNIITRAYTVQQMWHIYSLTNAFNYNTFMLFCLPVVLLVPSKDGEKCTATTCILKYKAHHQQLLYSQCFSDQGGIFLLKLNLATLPVGGSETQREGTV